MFLGDKEIIDIGIISGSVKSEQIIKNIAAATLRSKGKRQTLVRAHMKRFAGLGSQFAESGSQ